MTNEEALALIKATEYCYVVWSTTSNEVVSVDPLRDLTVAPGALTEKLSLHNETTVARIFTAAKVSMGTLSEQQAEISRVAERTRALRTLPAWDTEELIVPLETGEFPPNFSARHDAKLLIDELYYARSSQLSPEQLTRLEAVAAEAFFSRLGSRTTYRLECVLAVIRGDRSRLERLWESPRAGKARARVLSREFSIAAGDIGLDRDDIVEGLVRSVEAGWPFDVRFLSMLTLGKIGAPAGERAASAIATHIYDSSEAVSAARDRVLSRIRTPPDAWRACGACVRGMVRREGDWGFTACPDCLGIGHVQAEHVVSAGT